VNKNLLGGPTGWYLPEAAHPYHVLSSHADIDFASLTGPNPPVDPESVKSFKDDQSVNFLNDETVQRKLANAKKLSDVSAADYDAVFIVGGHGPVIDLPENAVNIQLLTDFYQSGKITAAVCHGTAALVNVKDTQGNSIFAGGKKFTGFSNAEEQKVGGEKAIPFSLEDRITALGGTFEKADEVFGAKVVVDGNLYTGQNPASAAPLAQEILKALKK